MSANVKPRDRVLAALGREVLDRCPMHISFTPEFARRLRADMGLPEGEEHDPLGGGNAYGLERALGEDMLLASVGWATGYYGSDRDYVDEWGVGWKASEYVTPFGKGMYTEIQGHPLASEDAVLRYRPPDPDRPELFRDAEKLIREHAGEHFIVGATVTTIFETAWALRGLEQLLLDFVVDPDLAEAVLDIPFRYHLSAAKRLAAMGVDMIWTGDDVGGQTAMLIAPAMWRRFLKPRMARFIAEVKGVRRDIKVAYHSDGAIGPVIPDLVEIGVDVLNPVQPRCMDPAALKRDFGDKLCFWGSIDEQRTLPFGSPEDVRAEVRERLGTIGRGGGLIIGPTHHVQLDTPLENLWAMVREIVGTPA